MQITFLAPTSKSGGDGSPPPVPTPMNEIKWISKAEKNRRRTVTTTIDAISENSTLTVTQRQFLRVLRKCDWMAKVT